MKILLAPDKFKGCLTAAEAAAAMAAGVRESGTHHEVVVLPIADGGEGTADVVRAALNGRWVDVASHDPRGRPLVGRYAWIESGAVAVIEMSAVAGLALLTPEDRDPLRTSTYGVGELIADACRRGARRILVGLGGSATNDAGVGMACALGWSFVTSNGNADRVCPMDFGRLVDVIPPKAFHSASRPEIVGACDVVNPLLGPRGATRVYGPQKGATSADVETLETALRHVADLVAKRTDRDVRDVPGAGAAGGLGYGLMAFTGARLTSGFDLVADLIGLEKAVAQSDWVITGEGCLDGQTLNGKGPAGVAALARKHGRPVIALAGRVQAEAREAGVFDHCIALSDDTVPTDTAMKEAASRLRAATRAAMVMAAGPC